MRRIFVAGLLVVSVLASSTAFGAMTKDVRTKFVSQCQKQMYYSGAQCSCMADIAARKLDDFSIAYLNLDALDVVHSAAMSKKMTGGENAAINNFMKTAPHTCKGAK